LENQGNGNGFEVKGKKRQWLENIRSSWKYRPARGKHTLHFPQALANRQMAIGIHQGRQLKALAQGSARSYVMPKFPILFIKKGSLFHF
jgi:hypothetical protein